MFFITNPSLMLFCFTNVICVLSAAHGIHWPSADQESLDEVNDAKLIKAVQQSMVEWKLQKSIKHRRKREDKSVCYGDLGCFEDSGPFGYLDMLPSSPEEIGTKFLFYSTKNRSERPILEFSYLNISTAWGGGTGPIDDQLNSTNDETTTKSPYIFDGLEDLNNLNVRVIVHGFGSSCSHVWIYEMRTALMAVEDCLIICIDWENGAILPNYVKAAANTRLVGKQLAILLKGLEEYKGLQMSRTHIIGFSLGGHVSGFAGAELNGLSRITGLDPAGPLFESQHPKARLDSSDANFVDVIHSNGENLILGGLGSWQPMGHVDFYPNGGRVQHGCSNIFVGAVTDFIWTAGAVEGRSLCNHRRSYKFFIDSVAPRCLFPAFPCDSYDSFLQGKCFPCDKAMKNASADARCGNMGYYADRSTGRGQLYLVTREEEPFCAHQYNVEIYSAESDIPLRTLGKLEVTLEGEGGLNETFSITEKDDTELFTGETISRILVPHPALGFPSGITLTYKSYSGWLSRGLPRWNIYKVVLTDSFGKSTSICKKYFSLTSGKPVHMSLQSGDCQIYEEEDDENAETDQLSESTVDYNDPDANENVSEEDENETEGTKNKKLGPVYSIEDNYSAANEIRKKDVINLGAKFKIVKNVTNTLNDEGGILNLPWQPVLEANSIDKELPESSRSFKDENQNEEIVEPILKLDGRRRNTSRQAHALTETEISEPILKSTTQRVTNKKSSSITAKRSYEESNQDSDSQPKPNGFVTVQLFPFRLGDLLERAERYARLTLLPLISEQAPKFFGFDFLKPDQEVSQRKPKYFPPLADYAEEEILDSKLREKEQNRKPKDVSIEERIDLNRNENRVIQPRSISSNQYYTNLNIDVDETDDNSKGVRIDLPTYKPPLFPYSFEMPETTENPQRRSFIPLIESSET